MEKKPKITEMTRGELKARTQEPSEVFPRERVVTASSVRK